MKNPPQITNSTYSIEDLFRSAIWRRLHSLLILLGLTLAWFLGPTAARAQGCYQRCVHLDFSTALGEFALVSNTTGARNTAVGDRVLEYNTTGSLNTATGSATLYLNTTGNDNTAVGARSLNHNTTGSFVIAVQTSVCAGGQACGTCRARAALSPAPLR